MKKIIYLGYLVNPEDVNKMSGASVAGNKMQWNVIKNLSQYNDIEIICVTISPLAAFPHDRNIFQKKEKEVLFNKVESIKVGFCNLPIIKQFWQIFSVYHEAKRILQDTDADIIFTFNLFPQVGIPMRWLKRKYRNLETVCLLADLPIDDNTDRRGISVILRKLFEKSTWKSMNVCDKYIVLNKNVIDKYLPNKSYTVIEGGVDDEDISRYKNIVQKSNEHNVLFCGALTEYNGILNLLEAMEYLKDTDIVLDVYGGGYLEEKVKYAAENNKNIRFHGRVGNQFVMKKQREAWLLINPRIVDDPIAQVTFPSKTFEYLLSGTPVLSSKLNCYNEEYFNCMYWLEDLSPISIANSIRSIYIIDKKEYINKGLNAKNMIVSYKSWSKQCKKIHDFMTKTGGC